MLDLSIQMDNVQIVNGKMTERRSSDAKKHKALQDMTNVQREIRPKGRIVSHTCRGCSHMVTLRDLVMEGIIPVGAELTFAQYYGVVTAAGSVYCTQLHDYFDSLSAWVSKVSQCGQSISTSFHGWNRVRYLQQSMKYYQKMYMKKKPKIQGHGCSQCQTRSLKKSLQQDHGQWPKQSLNLTPHKSKPHSSSTLLVKPLQTVPTNKRRRVEPLDLSFLNAIKSSPRSDRREIPTSPIPRPTMVESQEVENSVYFIEANGSNAYPIPLIQQDTATWNWATCSQQDICFECGSSGLEPENSHKHSLFGYSDSIVSNEFPPDPQFLICSQCAECFHPRCVEFPRKRWRKLYEMYSNEFPHLHPTFLTLLDQWRCSRCLICMKCGVAQPEPSLLKCDECDHGIHLHCLRRRLSRVPDGVFKCDQCVFCKQCGSRESDAWYEDYTLCGLCYSLKEKGNFCPICERVYSDNAYDVPMVECDTCRRWVHAVCDNISDANYEAMGLDENSQYKCPECCGIPKLSKSIEEVPHFGRFMINQKDDRTCLLCQESGDQSPDLQDRLVYCPQALVWIHVHCIFWCAGVRVDRNEQGCLRGVASVLQRLHEVPLCYTITNSRPGRLITCAFTGCRESCDRFTDAIKYGWSMNIHEDFAQPVVKCPAHTLNEESGRTENASSIDTLDMKNVQKKHSLYTSSLVSRIRAAEQRLVFERPYGYHFGCFDSGKDLQFSDIHVRAGTLCVLSLGKVMAGHHRYWSQDALYPIGYRVLRRFWSTEQMDARVWYLAEISEISSESGKLRFSIRELDSSIHYLLDSPNDWISSSSSRFYAESECCPQGIFRKLCSVVNAVRRQHNLADIALRQDHRIASKSTTSNDVASLDGHWFFALTSPSMKSTLEEMQWAEKCAFCPCDACMEQKFTIQNPCSEPTQNFDKNNVSDTVMLTSHEPHSERSFCSLSSTPYCSTDLERAHSLPYRFVYFLERQEQMRIWHAKVIRLYDQKRKNERCGCARNRPWNILERPWLLEQEEHLEGNQTSPFICTPSTLRSSTQQLCLPFSKGQRVFSRISTTLSPLSDELISSEMDIGNDLENLLAEEKLTINSALLPQLSDSIPITTSLLRISRGLSQEISMSSKLPLSRRYHLLRLMGSSGYRICPSPIQGRGLFATRFFERNEMIIEYTGELVGQKVADKREKQYDARGIGCYMFRIDCDLIIDATRVGNAARFANHSCEPNCYAHIAHINEEKHVILFSARSIEPGEELSYNYKFPVESDLTKKVRCRCGSRQCCGFMN